MAATNYLLRQNEVARKVAAARKVGAVIRVEVAPAATQSRGEAMPAVDMFRLRGEIMAEDSVAAERFTHRQLMDHVWVEFVRKLVDAAQSQEQITHLRSAVLRCDREAEMRRETRLQVVSTVGRYCHLEPELRNPLRLSMVETSS